MATLTTGSTQDSVVVGAGVVFGVDAISLACGRDPVLTRVDSCSTVTVVCGGDTLPARGCPVNTVTDGFTRPGQELLHYFWFGEVGMATELGKAFAQK